MSYRNPGQIQTKFSPLTKPSETSGKSSVNYTELAKKRAQANFDIIRKNDMAAQEVYANYSKVVRETPYVDQASLNNILSSHIDEYAAAKSRLETAVGFYEKVNPETNELLYSYDSDLKILANNKAFLNSFTSELSTLNYMTESFDKSGGFGSAEGQVDPMFTSPYFTLLQSVQNPFSEGVNVEYITEKDANGRPSLGIKLYGSKVAETNKITGDSEGDSYIIRPGELQKIYQNQDGDPSFEGLFYKNHTAIGDIKKQSQSIGLLNEKTGNITPDYMVDLGVETIVNAQAGYSQQVAKSGINKSKVSQVLDPIIISQANAIMRNSNTSTDVAINQYAQKDENGNYFFYPVKPNETGYYIDKQNPVIIGKDFYEKNLTEDNQKTFGYTQDQYNTIVELLKSNVYQDLSLTQKPQQTVIPNSKVNLPKPPKQTDQQIAKNQKADLIQTVRLDVEKLIDEGKKGSPSDIKEALGQLIDGKNIGSVGYDPSTGIVKILAPESVQGVRKEVLQFDINNLDQYSQRLNNLFQTGKVFEEAKLGETDVFTDLYGFAQSKKFDIKNIDEEDLVEVINNMSVDRGFRKLINDAGYERVGTSGKIFGMDEIVLIPKKGSGKEEKRIISVDQNFEGAIKDLIEELQSSSSNTSTSGADRFNKNK